MFRALLLAGLVTACSGNDDHVEPPAPGPVASLEVRPGGASILRNAQLQMTAVLYDSVGNVLHDHLVTWSSSDHAIAEISADGLLTGKLNGTVIVTATSEGITGEQSVLVSSGWPVAYVSVVPANRWMLAGSVVALEATPRDASGQPIYADINVTWTSNSAITAAFDDGIGPSHGSFVFVTFGSSGGAQVTASVDYVRNTADFPIRQVTWESVSAARYYSCGLTTDHDAYCWGNGDGGHLGTGAFLPEQVPTRVTGPVKFDQVSGGSATTCGLSERQVYCWGREGGRGYSQPTQPDVSVPTLVDGLSDVREVAVGYDFACAQSYPSGLSCWGVNRTGQLGSGNAISSGSPVPVATALRLSHISAGNAHACGLTDLGAAWCWGSDATGQLGDAGTSHCTAIDPGARCSSTPVAVAGAPALRGISAGGGHTCGIALDYSAWCWGANGAGQLGTGAPGPDQETAVPVAGGLLFEFIAAGESFTCAIDVDRQLWCWGENENGQLGNNGSADAASPVRVSVGSTERFVSLEAGLLHTCAVSTAGVGWCWGENALFELGSGRPKFVWAPIRLPG